MNMIPALKNFTHNLPVFRNTVLPGLLLVAVALGACSSRDAPEGSPAQADSPLSVGFIAFGDSGYHYDYIDEDDVVPPRATLADFEALERLDWIEDRRVLDEFVPPPAQFLKEHGSFVEASGLFPVASAIKNHCEAMACSFSVMLGDNIYPDGATAGADGRDDGERFERIFREPFGSLGAGVDDYRIYVALGNHDWDTSREGAMAQVEFMENNRPFYMDGITYTVKPPAGKGEIELFIIDTTVLLASTTVMEDTLNDDGTEAVSELVEEPEPWAAPATDLERTMVAWLEQRMEASDARWKFVIAHHPVWSTGGSKFEEARALRALIMPTLCRHADAYFAGHEHALEIHEDSCTAHSEAGPLIEIISGAAAKQRGVNTAFMNDQSRNYPQNNTVWAKGMAWGFAHIQLQGDVATVSMFNTPNSGNGEVIPVFKHEFRRRSGP